jgi:hypothetical protein
LLWEVHGRANDDHGFDAVGLQSGHVEEHIAAHAQADGFAFLDAEMVEQGESIERALAVRDGFGWVRRAPMATSVRQNQFVLTREFIASGVDPILV